MKNRNTIFFDLDGTLLPLNQDDFIKNYFGRLTVKLEPHGFQKDLLIQSIFAGMKVMQENDGRQTNEEAFWSVFEKSMQTKKDDIEEIFRDFYLNEFDHVREVLTEKANHKPLIDTLSNKGYQLILSTNPLFPIEAIQTRLSWIGLSKDDFSHITTFDNSSYCKPNIKYYEEILGKISKKPEECIMIGNDTTEDMVVEQLGFKVGLVTSNLENVKNIDISGYLNGTLEEVVASLVR